LVWFGLVWSGLVWSGLVWSGTVSASARRNHIRCHQKHRPDGQLETGRYLNSLVVDHNKTIENNNPELGRHSENIDDTEVSVLRLDCTGITQRIER